MQVDRIRSGPQEPISKPLQQGLDDLSLKEIANYGSTNPDKLPEERAGIEQLLRRLRSAQVQSDLLPGDRVKLATAEQRAWGQLVKMNKESEMSEDRIIRNHPKWRAIKQIFANALLPYPEAARAVLKALREAGVGDD
jgi:hypothetical protein